jgi:hypothetical protein
VKETRAFIRELLIIINRNVGPLPHDVQELYYKADEELKKVEELKEDLSEISKYQKERDNHLFGEDDEDETFRWDGLD